MNDHSHTKDLEVLIVTQYAWLELHPCIRFWKSSCFPVKILQSSNISHVETLAFNVGILGRMKQIANERRNGRNPRSEVVDWAAIIFLGSLIL